MGCILSSGGVPIGPVCLEHFDVQRVIGKGGFGKVHAVIKKGDPTKSWKAMKVMDKEAVLKQKRVAEVFRERNFLVLLRHERLCNSYYAFQDPKRLYMVMDIALGGDLRYQLSHTSDRKPFSESRVRWYFAQLATALDYIHSKGVIHRDIKPDNILMDVEGWIKLSDFGISAVLNENGQCHAKSGTRGYAPPELYTSSCIHGVKADWYSLAVTTHELLSFMRPFHTADLTNHIVESGKLPRGSPPLPPLAMRMEGGKSGNNDVLIISPECIAFHKNLLSLRDVDRMDPSEIKKHPWFTLSTPHVGGSALSWRDVENGVGAAEFLPDSTKMNANPDADFQEFFQGREEYQRLRVPTPNEQELFHAYDFDFEKDQARLIAAGDFNFSKIFQETASKTNVLDEEEEERGLDFVVESARYTSIGN